MVARANDQATQATGSPSAARRRPAEKGGPRAMHQAPPAEPRLQHLEELGRQLAPFFGWRGVLPGPTVDPRLVTTYCPSAMRRAEFEAELLLTEEGRAELAQPPLEEPDCGRPEDPEGPEALGLSPARNSEQPDPEHQRYGLHGLTPEGARSVRRATSALEERREQLAFWTITLPPDAMERVQELDAWPAFQNAVRHRLALKLKRRGLPPLVVAVAELHPARTAATGRPCPHLHVVFIGRRTRWNAWTLARWELDSIIRQACQAATGQPCSVEAAGNVQPVRRSVTRYLGAYITKGSAPIGVCGAYLQGLPRQWWFWTKELRALVLRHCIALPYRFVRWVHHHRDALGELGQLAHGQVELQREGSPAVFWLRWRGPTAAAAVFDRWVEIGCPMAA